MMSGNVAADTECGEQRSAMRPVPLSILTGFLGSGKTTLLKHILAQCADTPIAVIENELAEVGIDDRLLADSGNASVVALSNGCVCCSAGADLLHALAQLHERRVAGTIDFERVIVETTGLAGVASLARLIANTQRIARFYRLDAIVTIVDALNGQRQIDDFAEAREQIAIADRILISKTDLVAASDQGRLRERIARINARAPIAAVRFGDIRIADVLDLGAFDLDAVRGFDGSASDRVLQGHTDRIDTLVFRASRPFDAGRLDHFLSAIVDLYGPDLLRYKGVLHLDRHARQWIVQGVHSLVCVEAGAAWPSEECRHSAMVFIGRDLPKVLLREGLVDRPLARLPSGGSALVHPRSSWLHTI